MGSFGSTMTPQEQMAKFKKVRGRRGITNALSVATTDRERQAWPYSTVCVSSNGVHPPVVTPRYLSAVLAPTLSLPPSRPSALEQDISGAIREIERERRKMEADLVKLAPEVKKAAAGEWLRI